MKRLLWVLIFLAAGFCGVAQNLVPNSSFESYTNCPHYVSQLTFAPPWNSPSNGTPDYFNGCADVSTFMSVPDNSMGYEPAYEGAGYAGFYAGYNGETEVPPLSNPYREYLQCPLTQQLIPGHYYRLSFMLSLSDYSRFGVKEIGALFTRQEVDLESEATLPGYTAQVENPIGEVLLDKTGWTLFESCVYADSAYSHLIIGCFADNNELTIETTPSPYLSFFSYYFIDEVKLEEIPIPELGQDISTCEQEVSISYEGNGEIEWSTGETTMEIIVDTSGIYAGTITYGSCIFHDSVEVFIKPIPEEHLEPLTEHDFCIDPFATIGFADSSGYSYAWSNGSDSSTVSVSTAGIYSVIISNPAGCVLNLSTEIVDACADQVFFPNCFTPDNDGINDFFFVSIVHWDTFRLNIFNRWGDLIFSSNDPSKPWTGGDMSYSPDGIYNCRVDWTLGGMAKTVEGHISVIR